jgi:DNA-binding beta-propeller fold protein YncE
VNSAATVSVIDGAGSPQSVVATAAVGTNPLSIGVNAATNLIYVVNSGSNNVTVIDGTMNTTVSTTNCDGLATASADGEPGEQSDLRRQSQCQHRDGNRWILKQHNDDYRGIGPCFGGGESHDQSDLAPGNTVVDASSNAFAMLAGGGLDIGLSRHFAIRALEADYFMTRFKNGVNDRQNNIRAQRRSCGSLLNG